LIHTAALNLGLLMRAMIGVGTPRSLQGRLQRLSDAFFVALRRVIATFTHSFECLARRVLRFDASHAQIGIVAAPAQNLAFTTGC